MDTEVPAAAKGARFNNTEKEIFDWLSTQSLVTNNGSTTNWIAFTTQYNKLVKKRKSEDISVVVYTRTQEVLTQKLKDKRREEKKKKLEEQNKI